MWRSINFILVLLCLFGRICNPVSISAQEVGQEAQPEKPVQQEEIALRPPRDPPLRCDDMTTPAFLDNLSYLPVQFININEKNGILAARFASPDIFMLNQIEFKLTPENKDEKGLFFENDGKWEEEISRKTFLKKFKKDFWVVSYLTVDKERVICGAHQFKDWRALKFNYAQGVQNFDVGTIEFWNNLKSVLVYFKEIQENNAFWIFVQDLGNKSVPESDETITLQNGRVINKYQKFSDGNSGVVLDHDFFTISKNCVFQMVERKEPKTIKIPRVANPFVLGSQKIRVKPVDREYFVKNSLQNLWLCFYEKDYKNRALILLRAVLVNDVEAPPEKDGKKTDNGKKADDKTRSKPKK